MFMMKHFESFFQKAVFLAKINKIMFLFLYDYTTLNLALK